MENQKTVKISTYILAFLFVTGSFLFGYFLSSYFDVESITRGGRVQLEGAFQKLEMVDKALDAVEELVGQKKFIVKQQIQGDAASQYVVSIDGTLAKLDQPLMEYGFLVTVNEGKKNPLITSVLEREMPEQYYVFIREDIDGEYEVETHKLRE